MTGDDLRARRITAPASERAGHQNPSDPLMAALETLKYRAFLSYSHRDSAAAKRLHTRLEGFRIDKDLVGRATPMGPVPKQLRPTRSLSIRNPSRRVCSRFAAALSRWL